MASVVTGSSNSRTVRWFNDVSTWRTWVWLVVCAPAAAIEKMRAVAGKTFIVVSSGANTKEKQSRLARASPLPLGVFHAFRNRCIVEDELALPPILKKENPLLAFRALWIDDPLNEECPLFVFKPDKPVDRLWKPDANPLAAGHVCEGIDHLLGERLEQQSSRPLAACDDGTHRLCPSAPVFLLTLCPVMHEQMQGTELIPRILLVFPKGSLRLVAR